MKKDRTIIFTGAGAAIPWGAPKTEDITKAILSDRTFRSYTGQPIGEWLCHRLKGLYHKDPETINFETIINSLEYLVTFFSSKQRESIAKYKNLMPAFFVENDDIWEVLWFDRIYEKDKGFWRSNNERYQFYSMWDDSDYFFEFVYRLFINIIVKHVEEYSNAVNKKGELNSSLNEFLTSIRNPLRCYTTNYDRIIPKAYTGEMFEGFSSDGEKLKFNLDRVLTDESSNIYYNIHGSVHFDIDFPGNVKYVPDKYIYNFGHGASDFNDQDKRRIINSNIITGFNKPSRILTVPYLQYYHRFYQDCLFAEKIYIVGYSFGDIHINNAIKTASIVNKDLKIICVSYMVYNEEIDIETKSDWVALERKGERYLSEEFRYNIYEGIADLKNIDRISIYRKGFEQFLKRKHWAKY
jgi:hypothetical protein